MNAKTLPRGAEFVLMTLTYWLRLTMPLLALYAAWAHDILVLAFASLSAVGAYCQRVNREQTRA